MNVSRNIFENFRGKKNEILDRQKLMFSKNTLIEKCTYVQAYLNLRKITALEIFIKNEKVDLITDSHSILNKLEFYFCFVIECSHT
jgi:hypothetical protein